MELPPARYKVCFLSHGAPCMWWGPYVSSKIMTGKTVVEREGRKRETVAGREKREGERTVRQR